MAHTDRDDERYIRRHHWIDGNCPNSYRYARRKYGDDWYAFAHLEQRCEHCMFQPHIDNRYVGIDGKNHWNKQERRAERCRAKRAVRECRDYDDLSIRYRRPYWD